MDGHISLYFPDCMFSKDRRRLQSGARLYNRLQMLITDTLIEGMGVCINENTPIFVRVE